MNLLKLIEIMEVSENAENSARQGLDRLTYLRYAHGEGDYAAISDIEKAITGLRLIRKEIHNVIREQIQCDKEQIQLDAVSPRKGEADDN